MQLVGRLMPLRLPGLSAARQVVAAAKEKKYCTSPQGPGNSIDPTLVHRLPH